MNELALFAGAGGGILGGQLLTIRTQPIFERQKTPGKLDLSPHNSSSPHGLMVENL